MASTAVESRQATTVIAASATAGAAPSAATDGFRCNTQGGRVRTLVDYTGAVTAATLRLYVREAGSTAWFRGIATGDAGYPLTPANGDESRDWEVGRGTEFTFVLEAITPSGGAPTVAVKCVGVEL